jgi:type IX secretion system PorP/SprF family membrane protein
MNRTFLYYLLVSLTLMMSTDVLAQQDPQYTHYMYNMSVINPAYATDNPGVINLGGLYRAQWVGVEGAPTTGTFFAHTPLSKRVEVGLSFVNDQIGGVVNENNLYADFAYVEPHYLAQTLTVFNTAVHYPMQLFKTILAEFFQMLELELIYLEVITM